MRTVILALLVMAFIAQAPKALVFAESTCCKKSSCSCASGTCCLKGACKCPDKACCKDGICKCGQTGCAQCQCS